jgi:hypothetical protein
LKNSLAVIDCDCFQTFVERENFVRKDAGKFLAKILSGYQGYVTRTQSFYLNYYYSKGG